MVNVVLGFASLTPTYAKGINAKGINAKGINAKGGDGKAMEGEGTG